MSHRASLPMAIIQGVILFGAIIVYVGARLDFRRWLRQPDDPNAPVTWLGKSRQTETRQSR